MHLFLCISLTFKQLSVGTSLDNQPAPRPATHRIIRSSNPHSDGPSLATSPRRTSARGGIDTPMPMPQAMAAVRRATSPRTQAAVMDLVDLTECPRRFLGSTTRLRASLQVKTPWGDPIGTTRWWCGRQSPQQNWRRGNLNAESWMQGLWMLVTCS